MRVTVAICTWNRSERLRAALASLRELRIPPGVAWELLVVNNNCSDATDDVIAAFAGALPIRGLAEPRQGLSHARNRAVAEAAGDYILWTDDDVIADPGWLSAYADAFAAWPEASVFGGPIAPSFEDGPPPWLAAALETGRIADAYAHRDLGPRAVPFSLEGNMVPYGANFAVRMAEQRGFPYDPRLGLRGDDAITGEETNVVRAILAAGGEGRWVPGARIRHVIPRERQTVAYLRDYFLASGRTAVRRELIRDPAFSPRPPLGLGTAALAARIEYWVKRLTASPGSWCAALDRAYSRRGRLMEYRAMARRARLGDGTGRRGPRQEGEGWAGSSPSTSTGTTTPSPTG